MKFKNKFLRIQHKSVLSALTPEKLAAPVSTLTPWEVTEQIRFFVHLNQHDLPLAKFVKKISHT
jgi:hypothetical protein